MLVKVLASLMHIATHSDGVLEWATCVHERRRTPLMRSVRCNPQKIRTKRGTPLNQDFLVRDPADVQLMHLCLSIWLRLATLPCRTGQPLRREALDTPDDLTATL
jgi:hypothetical protein